MDLYYIVIYLDDEEHNIKRIDKLISSGVDVNICNPIKYITGIQYLNKPRRIQKIKHLFSMVLILIINV